MSDDELFEASRGYIATLQAAHGIDDALSFRWHERGGIVADLAGPHSCATVALQGGQVLSWCPNGEREVLWLSSAYRLDTSRPVRGGIPICWPWFGPHPNDPALPAHGFVRTAAWYVARSEAGDGEVVLVLSYATGGPGGIWPHTVDLTLEIRCGRQLTLSLETWNRGADRVRITQALHTYFRIGDIGAIEVEGLADRDFLDQAEGGEYQRHNAPLRFGGEVDRLYRETNDDVLLHDRLLERTLRVSKQGSLSTVVWNPGPQKAARLGDLVDEWGRDGWRRMVCIETANAGADAIDLAPDRRHTILTRVGVERSALGGWGRR
jgi:glucose-6-phosphate 1-epimerase